MRYATGSLTPAACRELGDGKHPDGDGLYLSVRGDSRAFMLRYSGPDGKRREFGLGRLERAAPHAPQTDLAVIGAHLKRIRAVAAGHRDRIRLGADPVAERVAARAAEKENAATRASTAKAARATLRRVAREFHETDAAIQALTPKHRAQWIASIENGLSTTLLDTPIGDIAAPLLLVELQQLYAATPETGRRVRQRLELVFAHAQFIGLVANNPAAACAPKLKAKRVRGRHRAMPFEEVPAFMRSLMAEGGTAAQALRFLTLTAARTAEVIGMTWGEIAGNTWIVPAARMKAGEDHFVALSAQAMELLARLRPAPGAVVSPYVFPSPTGKGPLSNMAMLELLKRMGVAERTTVHGMRASFSTWAYQTNAARPDVIEACLAHREANLVKAAYNRANFATERRQLLAAWADYLGSADQGAALKAVA